MKITSNNPITLPMYIGSKKRILEELMLMDLAFGIYIGIILVMFFYNMFVFFSVKDVSYLICGQMAVDGCVLTTASRRAD